MNKKPKIYRAMTAEEYHETRDPEAKRMKEAIAASETEAQRQKREYIEARKREREGL
jgi:hypothetical protein